MTPSDSSAPQGEEIITPIRLRTSPGASPPVGRLQLRRIGMAATLLLIATLTAGGIWWIGYLARRPLDVPAAAPPALPSPPPAETQASSEARQPPSPQPAAAPAPGPAALRSTEQTKAVKERVESAERLAAAGNLSAALSGFQEALRLDPQSQIAREGLQRIQSRMAAEEFRRWMAEGFSALNAGDFAQARSRFLKAKTLRPEAPEVAEALAQTESRQRATAIETARQKALVAEQREEWAGALSAYEEALGIEPTLQFAQQGKERVAALVALERRMAVFVNQPALLDSDAQLENASRLLMDLRAASALGSRLRAEADRLEALVQAAKTPIRIMIESDSLTEVSVYRVGRLGRFSTHELSLRPGTYTIVGSRDGYQDERRELVVRPGAEPIRATIVCKMKV